MKNIKTAILLFLLTALMVGSVVVISSLISQ